MQNVHGMVLFCFQCDPALLPEPNHVMLNHLYALSIKVSVQANSNISGQLSEPFQPRRCCGLLGGKTNLWQ